MVTLYTIGHSNHAVETLIDLLRRHAIEVVVDVRSSPYSRRNLDANRETLRRHLGHAGVQYVWMGDVLGGLSCVNRRTIDYASVERSERYQTALGKLEAMAAAHRTAVLCSEADPEHCHRSRLIGHSLLHRGDRIVHILSDGRTLEVVKPLIRFW